MNIRERSDFLGDGVYAIFDGFGITLNANDLHNPTDTIYLEPNVIEALKRFVDLCYKHRETKAMYLVDEFDRDEKKTDNDPNHSVFGAKHGA